MFRDSFKKELDRVKPSAEIKAQILSRLESAENMEGQKKAPVKKFRYAISVVAAVLCIAIVAVSVYGGLKKPEIINNTINDAANIAAVQTVTYSSVYNLFKDIYDKQEKENRKNALYQAFDDVLDGLTAATKDSATEEIILEDAEESVNDYGTGADPTATGTEEYSETNTQVKGIDEGDVVKTDGKYIYILKNEYDAVNIVLANSGKPEKIGEIKWAKTQSEEEDVYEYVSDMYVKGGRLIIVKYQSSYSKTGGKQKSVIAELYDVSSPEKPVLVKSFSQSGSVISTRLSGDLLYVFSQQTFYKEPVENDKATYVPTIGTDDVVEPVAEENICCFAGEIDRSYFVATSVNIKTGERIDEKSVLGGGSDIYVNSGSVYAAASECSYRYLEESDSNKNTDKTDFLRFAIDNGKLTFAASGSVKGTILNQFSMDEYNGYFRVVTTVNEYETTKEDVSEKAVASGSNVIADTVEIIAETKTTNALYVLNQRLETVGKIEGLAEEERVYSVRFDGDIGYFVTFRQVDPLFTVDLSNPANPKILSELKIPGFSSYLHPYGDGLLLGIGKNADEETGRVGNVKLSMFDVSDPENVTESNIESLPCMYTQADNTHKAVLVDPEKNLIGFAGSDYNQEHYFIYSYDESGFVLRAKLLIEDKVGYDVRGLYIGDYFYVCTQNSVTAYTLDSFEEITKIKF